MKLLLDKMYATTITQQLRARGPQTLGSLVPPGTYRGEGAIADTSEVGSVVGERDIERWFADQQTREARRREVCASKRWFATEAEARAVALWDRTQFGERLSPYRCGECDGWHLTGGRGRPRE